MQNSTNSGAWRDKVWKALRTDNVTQFSSLFPNEQSVKDAIYTIWKETNTYKLGKVHLIDVVASIRTYINNGRPALQCLTWLMETYPNAYNAGQIQYMIDYNECEMTKHVIVVKPDSEYNGLPGKIIKKIGNPYPYKRRERVTLDNNTDFDVGFKVDEDEDYIKKRFIKERFNSQDFIMNNAVQQGYQEINTFLRQCLQSSE